MACQRLTKTLWTTLQQQKTTFLLDCDGVLWHGNTAIPGAVDAVARLKELGKRVILVTNNSSRSRSSYVEKCESLGFKGISQDDVVTTSAVLADYMKNVVNYHGGKKVYVVGRPGITNELANVGIAAFGDGLDRMDNYGDDVDRLVNTPFPVPADQVGAVVVGFDPHISFPKAVKAATYLSHSECLFVATNDDETFPVFNPDIVCPGTGSVLAMIRTASGRTPVVLGKPNAPMFNYIMRNYGVKAEETVMVGDRLRTDVQFARVNGMTSLFVLTGDGTLEEVEREKSQHDSYIPDYFCDGIGDLAGL